SGLRELADGTVDRVAAFGGARRHVDRIEAVELEDMLRVDRVGVAQPVLDLGDGERAGSRSARRLWLGTLDPSHAGGASEAPRPVDVLGASRGDLGPARVAGDGRHPLQKSGSDRRYAGQLG